MTTKESFKRYKEMLIEWNAKFNLTAITDPDDIQSLHFDDSLQLLSFGYIKPGCRVADVGTGAGFPGLPLKIAMPDIKLTLMDSTNKKCTFLKEVVNELALSDVEVMHIRGEDAAKMKGHGVSYDVVTARAVAPLPKLVRYTLPLIKAGGIFLAMKSKNIEDEVEAALPIIKKMRCEYEKLEQYMIPGTDICRTVVVIRGNHGK